MLARSSLVALLLLLSGCAGLTPWDEPAPPAAATPARSAETLVAMGDYARARGDLTAAIALYRRGQIEQPDSTEALIKLGRALSEAGNYEEAAGAFRAALRYDDGETEALRGLGNAYLALNRPDEALAHLRAALAAADAPAVRNSLGVALDLLGRHAEAQQEYARGLAAAPDDLDLHANLALSLALVGRSEEALAMIREVVAAPQATPRHARNLALIRALAARGAAAAPAPPPGDPRLARDLAFYQGLKAAERGADQARRMPPTLPAAQLAAVPGGTPVVVAEPLSLLPPDERPQPATPPVERPATPPPSHPLAAARPAPPAARADTPSPGAARPRDQAPALAAAPPPFAPSGGDYRVQVGSFVTRAEAETARTTIAAGHRALLSALELRIHPADLGERGTWFRVQAVDLDKAGARGLCQALSQRGTDCLVLRAAKG